MVYCNHLSIDFQTSPSTYRRLYSCRAMRELEEKRNRKRANRPRMIGTVTVWHCAWDTVDWYRGLIF